MEKMAALTHQGEISTLAAVFTVSTA